ncbi:formylglycine-generating enzyme family protein, partial [bacterium]|nr:formylglycine-generating enzyme family protein [bacterium]
IIAILALIALGSLGAKAEGIVSNVNCLQMWPFDRSVIINYTLTSNSTNPIFDVKFYGSTDDGVTIFDLAGKGTITRDGANGTVAGSGEHKTIWSPDESFYETFSDDMLVKVEATEQNLDGTYMIIDLSGGTNATNFAISYLDDVPEGGWTDEYKTTKMVLRKIKAGKFLMGSPTNEFGRSGDETQHKVTLTKDFYIGVFETTQTQYKLIAGVNPSLYGGDMRPVDSVSYDTLRGANRGSKWPSSSRVDASSFFGILRAKTGKAFDLPTEAQWEYACRAGTTTALNNGCSITNYYADGNLNKLGRYQGNGGRDEDVPFTKNAHVIVGSYLPNAWGLYDMHGNVDEWCLDWHLQYSGDATDPKGPDGYSRCRVMRGGNWFSGPHMCRSAFRSTYDVPENGSEMTGVRIVLVP